MSERPPGIRRICIALTAERTGDAAPGGPRSRRWARDLDAVIERARRLGECDRAYWLRPPDGGGELALLPPGIDEGRFVAAFAGEIRAVLAERNAGAAAPARLRLRVALHQGITHLDEHGFSGRAVRRVVELRDCAALRAEFVRRPAADLALAVSAELFDDVVEHDYPGLRGRDFRRARTGLAAGRRAEVWLHAEASSPTVPLANAATTTSRPAAPRPGPLTTAAAGAGRVGAARLALVPD
ncbi:conserved hypothetical protein [Frankia canadensis]|uniref:Uncharacterized protein n=1 Tax=Frankia canadensis TaxID=1836972 RepID=A0A2I2KP31_9ACTN|nr:hypothetical protein [Frankia canadensis]SNQ47410.1 conserved hypothetical protein [Frankia canadensis]SOU54700.1 conserved hypothetical protein [Frankia canadensis]